MITTILKKYDAILASMYDDHRHDKAEYAVNAMYQTVLYGIITFCALRPIHSSIAANSIRIPVAVPINLTSLKAKRVMAFTKKHIS